MAHLAHAHCPIIELESVNQLTGIRETVLGKSHAAKRLQPLFIETLLKTSAIRIDCKDFHSANTEMISLFTTTLPTHIRRLGFVCSTRIACDTIYNSVQLYRAACASKSLKETFPKLKTLDLEVRLQSRCMCGPNNASDIICRYGLGGNMSLREIIQELLTVLKNCGPLEAKTLKMITRDDGGFRLDARMVAIDDGRTVEELTIAVLGEQD